MSDHALELQIAWQRHVAPSTDLLDRVIARHREKHRRYHNVAHVAWVVRNVETLAGDLTATDHALSDEALAVAAAFYHDAVYEPRSPARANERASARLARRDLAGMGWDEQRANAAGDMIEATADHLDPASPEVAVLFDADLSVLGADPAGYGDYTRNVRAEYAHVSDDDWHSGRSEVLERLLERPTIFATEPGRARWEERARANITAELELLRSG